MKNKRKKGIKPNAMGEHRQTQGRIAFDTGKKRKKKITICWVDRFAGERLIWVGGSFGLLPAPPGYNIFGRLTSRNLGCKGLTLGRTGRDIKKVQKKVILKGLQGRANGETTWTGGMDDVMERDGGTIRARGVWNDEDFEEEGVRLLR